MEVTDQTVFITGAGSGLGRAAAIKFAEAGARIVGADVDLESAERTVELVDEAGGGASAVELDVRDADAFQSVVDATVEEYGLDVIVNNAGVVHDRANVETIDESELDRLIDVNVKGVWNGCRVAIPHFKRLESGRIVNTASLAGVIGSPQLSAYSLTKGAVVNFTRAIAAEVGPFGIRANAVCPAVTETPMARGDRSADEWEALEAELAQQYPLRRLGRPEDVANAMLFLASDASDWVTGHALVVDGGFSCA